MNPRFRNCVVGAALAAALLSTHGLNADDDVAPAESSRITRLIEQLGSTSFDEREAAEKSLRAIGQPARPQLLEARRHTSAEVRSRAAALMRQLDIVPLVDAFHTFASQSDEKLDLEEGMWLIARILNKDLQRIPLARQLDRLADAVRKKLGEGVVPSTVDPERLVTALRQVLFQDEKFAGNVEDYQNPDNSSLEKVLQTKKGLPILLSHLVVAVGRRLDVPLVGVPTGGRYIVKYDGRRAPAGFPRSDIYFDPFDGGKVLDRDDRRALFPGVDPDRMVEPQSSRKDLVRMLINLETHLFGRDQSEAAYLAVQFRVALDQNSSP